MKYLPNKIPIFKEKIVPINLIFGLNPPPPPGILEGFEVMESAVNMSYIKKQKSQLF